MSNILTDKFEVKHTNHYIKALGGEVVLRELTLKENNDLLQSMIKDVDSEGQADIDYAKALEVKYEKISLALVEPEMTVEQLKNLSSSAKEALDEIYSIIDPKTAQLIDEELSKEGKE